MRHIFSSFYLDAPLVPGRVFDIFEPDDAPRDVALFIVHGGGWRAGSRTAFHPLMEAFNREGFIAASTDYRLTAADALEQLADIRAAYDRFVSWLKEKNRPLKIAVYGESAGSHLASLLICARPGECGEKIELKNEWTPPAYGILHATPASFEPWEDIFPGIWSVMQNIAGKPYAEDPERYQRLSLHRYIRPDNPPVFFIEAGNEHMFPTALTRALLEKQRSYGIASQMKIYKNMEHGFFYALDRPQQREAFADIVSFLTPIQR